MPLHMILIARGKYIKNAELPAAEGSPLKPAHKLVYHKYYVDEIYDTLFVRPLSWLSKQFHAVLELRFIDYIVNGTGNFVVWSSNMLRYAQAGNTGIYLLVMVLGTVLILFINGLL
jgi:NADH-quinone oxidoreductase subunit L